MCYVFMAQVLARGCCEVAPSPGPRILMVLEGAGRAKATGDGPSSDLKSDLELAKGVFWGAESSEQIHNVCKSGIGTLTF